MEIHTPHHNKSNSFSHQRGFEVLHRPISATHLVEQQTKQSSDNGPNDKLFDYIRNPKGHHVFNSKERNFVSQIYDFVDFSEIVPKIPAFANTNNIFTDFQPKEDNCQFVIPSMLKASCEFFAKNGDKYSEVLSEIVGKIYIDDRERIKFFEYLRSQPSYKFYAENDKLACFDELFGQESKPAIFVNLYKLLGKVFKNESIKALDFQLTQNEQQILQSIIVRKYNNKITAK